MAEKSDLVSDPQEKQLLENRTDIESADMKKKENLIFTKTYNFHDDLDQKIFTDQTGRFPLQSYQGNQYIMVLIRLVGISILVEAIQNRTPGEMIRAYQTLVDRLKECEIKPKLHILDNKCSIEFKKQMKTNNMKYQLVPPHNHMQNISQKVVQTFKDHFVAVLCGTDA